MPFIKQVPSPSPPPPAIYDTSEHNKENIPPFDFVNQFHLPNIIPKFDARFKTFSHYWNYWNWHLTSWMSDPDFSMFNAAYCHHWLVLRQKEGLLDMRRQIDKQLEELETQDQVQWNKVELLIPNLKTKGFTLYITETLGRSDIVGETPFSYPISQWNPPNHNPPTTPTPSPNPVIPKLKKKHKFGEECPKCRCKYLYDHVATGL